MKRIIAVNSNCYHGYTIEEAIAGIREAGFHYIELTATKGWTEHVFPDMPFERLLAIQNLLRQNELTPFSMSGHCNLMDPERIPDFEKNIRLAAFFGCQYIVSSIGEAHLANKAVADDDEVARRVASLIPMLEENNLILVLETHGKEHGTGEKLARIVRKIGSPRVKLNYDTANVIFYGGVDPVQDLKTCMAETAYIHIKDKGGRDDVWDFPALGKGMAEGPHKAVGLAGQQYCILIQRQHKGIAPVQAGKLHAGIVVAVLAGSLDNQAVQAFQTAALAFPPDPGAFAPIIGAAALQV